jgi:hypothetical protein
MRVRKDKSRGESAEDDVSELDTTRRDYVTKSEVVFAQELWEIVEKDQKKSKGATIQVSGSKL